MQKIFIIGQGMIWPRVTPQGMLRNAHSLQRPALCTIAQGVSLVQQLLVE